MSDFKAKMHQIRFRLGLGPRHAGGAYSVPPDPLAGFKGSTSKGRGGREGERWPTEGKGEGKEGQGRGNSPPPPQNIFGLTPLQTTRGYWLENKNSTIDKKS